MSIPFVQVTNGGDEARARTDTARNMDAFKKAMDDPKHMEVLGQLNQAVWYRNGEDYRKWATETFAKDKALIERLGLAAK